MKHVRRGMAAIASLALTAALLAVGASPATAAPAAPRGHGNCKVVPAGSGLHKRGAAWSCFGPDSDRRVPASALAARDIARAPADGANAVKLCLKNSSERVVSDRHAYCTRMFLKETLLDKNNAPIGEGHISVLAVGLLDSYAGKWTDHIIVVPGDMTGKVTGVEVSLDSACSGMCSVQGPAWGGGYATVEKGGDNQEGAINYVSSVAAKTDISYINVTYTVSGAAVGGVGVPGYDTAIFDGPQVRCDATIGDTTPVPGCIVFAGHTPNVTFSRAKYRGAAIAYEWAQKNLTGQYGTPGHLLSRYIDPLDPDAEKRRALTCDRGPYKFPRGATGILNDSCDEYPFARSWQGGNPGDQCVDITPRPVGGVWDVSGVTVDRGTGVSPYNAPCIRAHVDNKDNTAAGGELGRAVQSDRILDSEWYEVIIVP
ncbi:NucA/NucB deoxyribonuclease domain-containing protein [Streptomyces violascens]|uniref:NucA/NucB deoxyribonuclease domain-containing protein n=2 Tax=Streptomyces violascens TaxID=67381 RepID=UPI0036BFAA39